MAETRTIPLAQVQALSQKWDDETEGRSDVASFAIRSCADQLDALIASALALVTTERPVGSRIYTPWVSEPYRSGQESASPWRPIAEAPKDEYVLVLCAHGMYVACLDERVHGKGIWGWSVDDNKHGPYPLRGASPTHWMPLPDPPPAPASERPETERL